MGFIPSSFPISIKDEEGLDNSVEQQIQGNIVGTELASALGAQAGLTTPFLASDWLGWYPVPAFGTVYATDTYTAIKTDHYIEYNAAYKIDLDASNQTVLQYSVDVTNWKLYFAPSNLSRIVAGDSLGLTIKRRPKGADHLPWSVQNTWLEYRTDDHSFSLAFTQYDFLFELFDYP